MPSARRGHVLFFEMPTETRGTSGGTGGAFDPPVFDSRATRHLHWRPRTAASGTHHLEIDGVLQNWPLLGVRKKSVWTRKVRFVESRPPRNGTKACAVCFRPRLRPDCETAPSYPRTGTIPRRSRSDDRKDQTHEIQSLDWALTVRPGGAPPRGLLRAGPLRIHDVSRLLRWSAPRRLRRSARSARSTRRLSGPLHIRAPFGDAGPAWLRKLEPVACEPDAGRSARRLWWRPPPGELPSADG
jgi:hypothetical protein